MFAPKPLFCFGMIIFFLLSPFWSGTARAAEKLVITGSSTMCPLIADIGKRFQQLHPDIQVDVQCGGSGRGISDARDGKADIGMVSRTLTDKENNLYGFPIARDGISIILHKNNPVKFLSDAQVVGIYTGKITNWKIVGGRNISIAVVNPKKGYSSAELFTHYFKIDSDDRRR